MSNKYPTYMSKAVIYYTSGERRPVTPSNGSTFTLEELQSIVGGYIQIAPTPHKDCCLVIDEEGLVKGLEYNLDASLFAQYPIVGKALVCDSCMIE